jgi:hypothetical protein
MSNIETVDKKIINHEEQYYSNMAPEQEKKEEIVFKVLKSATKKDNKNT